MLINTFIHIPSVGSTTERRIWDAGITTHDAFLASPPSFISTGKRRKMNEWIHISKATIQNQNPDYFYANLPSKEHWRLFKDYQNSIAYIDIETTGMGSLAEITTIALYDGKRIRYYINGKNLDDFPADLQKYKVIVSYNGKTFDVPVIESYFGIKLSHAHLDLRYILKNLGYSGGLKSCERQLGIGRTGCLSDVDGFFAVLLWYDYQRNGNAKALETLLAYNIEDVLQLEFLMIEAYNRKIKALPFKVEEMFFPMTPANPFRADEATVRCIQRGG